MRNRELMWGTALNYVQQIVNVLFGLLYTPFLIRSLGQAEYGLYGTVSSAISMLSLLSLGLGSGYIRYYARYKKSKDESGINKLNGLYLLVFCVIGVVALAVGLVVSNNLTWIFDRGLSADEYVTAKKLAILLSVKLAVTFPGSVFGAIVSAHEKFVFSKTVGLGTNVVSHGAVILALLMGKKSIAIVTVSLCVSVLSECIYLCYVLFVLRQQFVFTGLERGLLKGVLIYVLPIAANLLIDQVNWNIDRILLGRFRGTKEVAVYNVGYALFNMYMTLSIAVSEVFTPRVHDIVAGFVNDVKSLKGKLTHLFIKVGRIQAELLLLVVTGLIFFGMPFISDIWAGREYINSYYVLLLLTIPCTIPLMQNLGIEIQRALNIHRFRSVVYGFMAVINLLVSVMLCKRYGAIGCAIGTAVSLFLCNGLVMNIYYHKKCHIDIVAFWKNIGRLALGAVPPVILWLLFGRLLNIHTISGFILGVVLYTVTYCCSMWLIGMNDEEKCMIKGALTSIHGYFIRSR